MLAWSRCLAALFTAARWPEPVVFVVLLEHAAAGTGQLLQACRLPYIATAEIGMERLCPRSRAGIAPSLRMIGCGWTG